MIDLRPSPDQQSVIDSISGYLGRHFPLDRFQPNKADNAGKTVRAAWPEIAEQGFLGLSAPEGIGGAGFTIVEEMLAHREFGRALLSPSVLATVLAVHLAHEAGLAPLAASLARGERVVALASGTGSISPGSAVDGAMHIADSQAGDLVLVNCADGLALIERDDLTDMAGVAPVDETVSLHHARAKAVNTIACAAGSQTRSRQRITLLIAASLTGIAEATRDLAVAHAGIREQFGKTIGSFQAVAHHCADMELRARAARAETAFAALGLRDGRADAPFHVLSAAIVAADAAIQNATIAIRIHGGMGFTAECPVQFYLKRTHLYERMAGGVRSLQSQLLQQPAALNAKS